MRPPGSRRPDLDDRYRIIEVAYFSSRYGHLARWNLSSPIDQFAGQEMSLGRLRAGFALLLLEGAHQSTSTTWRIITRTRTGKFTAHQRRRVAP